MRKSDARPTNSRLIHGNTTAIPPDILRKQSMVPPPSPEQTIFTDVLALAATERGAFLDCACGGNAALRSRIEALLAAHAEAERQLPAPLVARETLAPEEKTGDRIGRYKLLETIGEGGCGVVWLAEQEEPVHRRVALKVIKLGMDTREVIARFEAERQALALMDHPNIAKVFDAGATATGRPFFVMELVRGVPVTKFCDEANASTAQRLELFIQVCHAVQHAHQKGIIHRDLKPSNILVTVNDGVPVPKVIDFGIAKATQGRLTDQTLFTAFEQFIGTPAYMSPEQAVMTSVDVDTRSDIYSLGVLLYELLTGRTPFDAQELAQAGLDEIRRRIREVEPPKPSTRLSTMQGEALATVAQHRHTDPPKLVNLVRGDLDWIVMKALEKDRTRRYATANSLADDLAHFLRDEPVAARPPSRFYRFQKLVHRHRFAFAAAGAIAAALVIGTAVATWQAVRAQRAETNERAQRLLAETGELAARRRAYASDVRAAQIALDQSNLGRCRELLKGHVPLPGQVDFRGFEWRLLWGESRSHASAEFRHDRGAFQAVLLPDRKTLVTRCADGAVTVWDTVARRVLRQLPSVAPRFGVPPKIACSPDGSLLAACHTDGVALYETISWTMVRQLSTPAEQAAFTPDGKELVLTSVGQLIFWNLAAEAPVMKPNASKSSLDIQYQRTVFSPDGRLMFVSDRFSRQIEVWEMPSRSHTGTLSKVGHCISMAVSPDGRWLAAGRWDGTVSLWTLPDLELVATTQAHTGVLLAVAFSPDSRLLATGGNDQLIKLWRVPDSRAAPELVLQETLKGHRDEIWSLAFSADGQQLVSASKDQTARLWPVVDEKRKPVVFDISPAEGSLYFCFLSARHGLVWTGYPHGPLIGWNFRTGQATRSTRVPVDPKNIWNRWIDVWGGRWFYHHQGQGVAAWDPLTERSERLLPGVESSNLHGVITQQGRTFLILRRENPPRVEAWLPGATSPCSEPWTRALAALNLEKEFHCLQSPDGKLLAIGRKAPDFSVVVTTLDDPPVLQRLVGHRLQLYSYAFSPDSKRLAAGSFEGTPRVWDLASAEEAIHMIGGHRTGVIHQEFTPDGRTLLTVGGDGIRFWNVQNGQEMLVWPGRDAGEGESRWELRWLVPPDTADGLLTMSWEGNQVRFIPVPTLAAIDEEIRREEVLATPKP
jgi:WD40 repeat protein